MVCNYDTWSLEFRKPTKGCLLFETPEYLSPWVERLHVQGLGFRV